LSGTGRCSIEASHTSRVIPLDANLSAVTGATMVEVRVDAGPDSAQDWAAWKGLRVEGVVG
jgi:hypothetical protein